MAREKKIIPEYYNQISIQLYQKTYITNREQLIDFLSTNSNTYHNFILKKLNEPVPTKTNMPGFRLENHHIIPKHTGGLDESWNIIKLTFEDHSLTHLLLAETYRTLDDYAVYLWRSGFDIDKRNQHSKRMKQISIFKNPNFQRQFGKKGGKTFTVRRNRRINERQNEYLNIALKKGTVWYFKPLDLYILVKTDQCLLIINLANYLLMQVKKALFNYYQNQHLSFENLDLKFKINFNSFCSGLSDICESQSNTINSNRTKKPNRLSVYEFYLLGIICNHSISYDESYYRKHNPYNKKTFPNFARKRKNSF